MKKMSSIFHSIINFLTSPKRAKFLAEENMFLEDQIEELIEQDDDRSKELTKQRNKIIAQIEEIKAQKEEIKDLKNKLKPSNYIKTLFDNNFEWYDYEELTDDNKKIYLESANYLLENPVFKNEINFLINNQKRKAIEVDFDDPKSLQLSSNIQTAAVILNEFKERISEISCQKDKTEEEDLEPEEAAEAI